MSKNKSQECNFEVGQQVRFKPSVRTKGLYQDIESFGIIEDQIYKITEIRDGVYLYFREGGGWPFNEFKTVKKQEKRKVKKHTTI